MILIFAQLYFILALLNSLILILIFVVRKTGNINLVKKLGYIYLLLVFPAIYLLVLSITEHLQYQYTVFLSIFIVYLILEFIYDYVLKIDFRKNWKLLTPYLALYYAMNYGFIVMVWKNSIENMLVVLILTVLQIAANLWSHKTARKEEPK